MTRLMLTAMALAVSGAAVAKLPPPDEAAKAKAAEAAAKSAWQAKVDAFQLCKAQDRVVAAYKKMATWGKKMWMKHGALAYFECMGDDLAGMPNCGNFKTMARLLNDGGFNVRRWGVVDRVPWL